MHRHHVSYFPSPNTPQALQCSLRYSGRGRAVARAGHRSMHAGAAHATHRASPAASCCSLTMAETAAARLRFRACCRCRAGVFAATVIWPFAFYWSSRTHRPPRVAHASFVAMWHIELRFGTNSLATRGFVGALAASCLISLCCSCRVDRMRSAGSSHKGLCRITLNRFYVFYFYLVL